jgi:YVTN family beta-propeller protein
VAPISVGLAGHHLALSPGGSQIHVANNDTNDVTIIDVATRQLVQTYGVGAGAARNCFFPDGSEVYTANLGGDSVTVVSLVQ